MQSYLKKKVLVDPDQNKISWIEPILSEESLKVWIHDFLTKEEVDPIPASVIETSIERIMSSVLSTESQDNKQLAFILFHRLHHLIQSCYFGIEFLDSILSERQIEFLFKYPHMHLDQFQEDLKSGWNIEYDWHLYSIYMCNKATKDVQQIGDEENWMMTSTGESMRYSIQWSRMFFDRAGPIIQMHSQVTTLDVQTYKVFFDVFELSYVVGLYYYNSCMFQDSLTVFNLSKRICEILSSLTTPEDDNEELIGIHHRILKHVTSMLESIETYLDILSFPVPIKPATLPTMLPPNAALLDPQIDPQLIHDCDELYEGMRRVYDANQQQKSKHHETQSASRQKVEKRESFSGQFKRETEKPKSLNPSIYSSPEEIIQKMSRKNKIHRSEPSMDILFTDWAERIQPFTHTCFTAESFTTDLPTSNSTLSSSRDPSVSVAPANLSASYVNSTTKGSLSYSYSIANTRYYEIIESHLSEFYMKTDFFCNYKLVNEVITKESLLCVEYCLFKTEHMLEYACLWQLYNVPSFDTVKLVLKDHLQNLNSYYIQYIWNMQLLEYLLSFFGYKNDVYSCHIKEEIIKQIQLPSLNDFNAQSLSSNKY